MNMIFMPCKIFGWIKVFSETNSHHPFEKSFPIKEQYFSNQFLAQSVLFYERIALDAILLTGFQSRKSATRRRETLALEWTNAKSLRQWIFTSFSQVWNLLVTRSLFSFLVLLESKISSQKENYSFRKPCGPLRG